MPAAIKRYADKILSCEAHLSFYRRRQFINFQCYLQSICQSYFSDIVSFYVKKSVILSEKWECVLFFAKKRLYVIIFSYIVRYFIIRCCEIEF